MTTTDDERTGLSLGVIVPDLSTAGGAERLALQCVARWQRRHRVTLYSTKFDPEILADLGVDVRCRELSRALTRAPHAGVTARPLDALVTPRIWASEIGSHDVYLGHQWRSLRVDRSPFVWYGHETERHAYDLLRERDSEAVRREMEHLFEEFEPVAPDVRYAILQGIMRDLDAGSAPAWVVANSRFTAAEFERSLGVSEARVVYPGVDADAFDEPSFDERFFLSVGNLLPHKRHRLAVEALALVPDARLMIVGRGRTGRELERMAARLGVLDRLEIRNAVTDDELRSLYARCRAVAFTPVNEPFGMVALETMAAGKPLVAVDQGGFCELVDSSCAMLVPPEPPAIAEAFRVLLDRPDEARRMGEAARKVARAWSWDRVADELEAILVEAYRESRDAARALPERGLSWRPAEGPAERPEIGVRLVLDYGEGASEGGWRAPGAIDEMPRAGYYASHHESTLRRQLAEIERCGFDFVVLSLWLDDRHLSPHGATALRHALDLAAELERTPRFAVELVAEGPTPALLARALDWLARLLRARDAVLTVEGRPLVLLRGASVEPDDVPPALCVLPAPDPGSHGDLRAISLAREPDLGPALAAALTDPPPRAVIVSSWNDYAAGEFLEPTAREGERRLEAALRALAQR